MKWRVLVHGQVVASGFPTYQQASRWAVLNVDADDWQIEDYR